MIPKTTLRKSALVASLFAFLALSLQAQVVSFNDPNFKAALIENPDINTNGDGEIQVSEAEAYTGGINVNGRNISDLTGIEAFTQIVDLRVHNNLLTSLDVSANTQLRQLHCQANQLTSLDLSSNPDLTMVRCHWNQLTSLDISTAAGLRYLECHTNQLTSLDVGANAALRTLQCYDNQLSSLNLSLNASLRELNCHTNQLSSLDLGNNTDLFYLDCSSNQLTSLDVTNNPDLNELRFPNNQISEIDLSANTALQILWTQNNQLSTLDVSNHPDLYALNCSDNQLTSVNLGDNSTLRFFFCFNNQLSELDVSGNPAISSLSCYNNQLQSLDVTVNPNLTTLLCQNNQLSSLNMKNGNNTAIYDFQATDNPPLECIEVDDPAYAQANWSGGVDEGVEFSTDCGGSSGGEVVYIPDQNFKDALLANEDINTNGDDEIQVSEAESYAGQINVAGHGISDLTGIEAFTAVTDLRVHYNSLSMMDLSSNTALKKLHFQNNQVTSIDLSANTELDMIRAQNNDLMKLDLSANSDLRYLEVQNNDLTELNIQNGNNTSMYAFNATGNPGLTCIQVDDVAYAEANWSDDVDEGASFSTDCGYSSGEVVYIPDQNFKNALLTDGTINTNGDDEIQVSETEGVTVIDVGGHAIADLTGAEAFEELLQLIADGNNLTALDVSDMGLDLLDVTNNQLNSLNLGGIVEYLYAEQNNLSCIQTATPDYYYDGNPNVEVDEGVDFRADCDSEPVVYIPDQYFKSELLANEDINTNGDDEIQVSEAENFAGEINVSVNSISDLTGIEAFTALTVLRCNANSLTGTLDVRQNVNLMELYCQQNNLTGILFHENLDKLSAAFNNLGTFDISETPVNYINVAYNGLTSLNLATGTVIEYIYAQGNSQMYCIQVDEDFIEEGLTRVVDEGTIFSTDCGAEEEPVVYIPDPNFKNALVSNSSINSNGDGEIQVRETRDVYDLDVSGQGIGDLTGIRAFDVMETLDVADNNLTELDVFGMARLKQLDCSGNTLTELNLHNLYWLDCSDNNLMSLNLKPVYDPEMYFDFNATGNPNLACVEVYDVAYAEANWSDDVDPGVVFSTDCSSSGPAIVHIPDANFKNALLANEDINTNGDSEIQVTEAESFSGQINVAGQGISDLTGIAAFTALTDLRVHYNNLTSIDVSANAALEKLHFQNNMVGSIDLSSNTALEMVRAQNNELSGLDLSGNTGLRYLEVQNNELTSLNIQNGNNTAMYAFNATGNPALSCVQVDDVVYAEANWSDDVDAGASFSTDCSGAVARFGPADESLPESSGPAAEIVLYPVPAVRELRVRAEQLANDTELYLFNVEGQEFYRETISSDGSFETLLNLDEMNLNSGVYYIRLVGEEGSITKKFIKQ